MMKASSSHPTILKLFALAPILILVSVALSSCNDEEEPAATPAFVKTTKVTAGPSAAVSTFTGEVEAKDQSDLGFRVSGQIEAMHVEVGETIRRGQLLAELDDRQQRADLEIATAGLKSTEAQLERARSARQRQESLFRQGVTPKSSLDEADESLKTSENSVVAARSEVASAQEALSYTRLVASGPGIVLSRDGEVGQIAQEAQPVLTVASGAAREAVFNVPESVLLTPRQTVVTVSLLDARSRRLKGQVSEISPAVDLETGTLMVKVSLPADATDFPLGAPVSGIFASTESNAIVLPWTALTSSAGFPAVWIVDAGTSSVSLQRVELGLYQTGSFQVLGGLNVNDVVVSEGGKLLRVGQKISPVEDTSMKETQ
jgi:membrane fusion protein, multidrug efflux system